MREYNPAKSPDRQQWLALDKTRQLEIIRLAHDDMETSENALATHCGMHSAVETQIAQNSPGVRNAMGRLRKQGTSRHNALHAIGLVLIQHMRRMATSQDEPDIANAHYQTQLAELGQR
jgi:hypothetical protein